MLLLSSCGMGVLVRGQVYEPAYYDMGNTTRLAVKADDREGSSEVASMLHHVLIRDGRFDVLERQNLGALIREQDLALSDYSDPDTSVELGRMVGAAAYVFVSMNTRDYREHTTETKNTCSRKVGGVRQSYTCYYNTLSAEWDVSTTFKVVDPATSRVRFHYTVTGSRSRRSAAMDATPARYWDVSAVFHELAERLAASFLYEITPHDTVVPVRLFSEGSLPDTKAGVDLAQAGNWEEASRSFGRAVERAERDPRIKPRARARAHYNLGVALSFTDRLDEAEGHLTAAISLARERVFVKEIDRVRDLKERVEKERQRRGSG